MVFLPQTQRSIPFHPIPNSTLFLPKPNAPSLWDTLCSIPLHPFPHFLVFLPKTQRSIPLGNPVFHPFGNPMFHPFGEPNTPSLWEPNAPSHSTSSPTSHFFSPKPSTPSLWGTQRSIPLGTQCSIPLGNPMLHPFGEPNAPSLAIFSPISWFSPPKPNAPFHSIPSPIPHFPPSKTQRSIPLHPFPHFMAFLPKPNAPSLWGTQRSIPLGNPTLHPIPSRPQFHPFSPPNPPLSPLPVLPTPRRPQPSFLLPPPPPPAHPGAPALFMAPTHSRHFLYRDVCHFKCGFGVFLMIPPPSRSPLEALFPNFPCFVSKRRIFFFAFFWQFPL
eukprot:XP_024998669.1 leucine-rich repeat extensin-like protein 3 [Gallus gallus]